LSLIAKLVWQGDEITSIILFFIGLVPCMPIFFFFYALVGGWDDAGLDETVEAYQMVGFLRPVVNIVFIVPSKWGARISPLHNRFPITMRPAAKLEAQLLTDERVKLVQGKNCRCEGAANSNPLRVRHTWAEVIHIPDDLPRNCQFSARIVRTTLVPNHR
jgi:hypothetical protein